jgi:hypothetical protein
MSKELELVGSVFSEPPGGLDAGQASGVVALEPVQYLGRFHSMPIVCVHVRYDISASEIVVSLTSRAVNNAF